MRGEVRGKSMGGLMLQGRGLRDGGSRREFVDRELDYKSTQKCYEWSRILR
jgi:hypothetical protein